MCRAFEEERAEGRAEGIKQAMESNIINMLKEKLQPSMVARITQMTVEEVTALGKQAGVL